MTQTVFHASFSIFAKLPSGTPIAASTPCAIRRSPDAAMWTPSRVSFTFASFACAAHMSALRSARGSSLRFASDLSHSLYGASFTLCGSFSMPGFSNIVAVRTITVQLDAAHLSRIFVMLVL